MSPIAANTIILELLTSLKRKVLDILLWFQFSSEISLGSSSIVTCYYVQTSYETCANSSHQSTCGLVDLWNLCQNPLTPPNSKIEVNVDQSLFNNNCNEFYKGASMPDEKKKTDCIRFFSVI